jgi:general secretion pathway protein J
MRLPVFLDNVTPKPAKFPHMSLASLSLKRNGRRAVAERGFTLLELMIALAIVAALLGVAFGGLRVALASWRRGEERTEAHQRVRGLVSLLAHAVEGAHPYRGSRSDVPETVILFNGTSSSLDFVTRSAPYPYAIPIAFSAVGLTVTSQGETPGLVVKQRPLPNWDPFTKAEVKLTEPSVTAISFRYLDSQDAWRDAWDVDAGDPETQQAIPKAIEISLVATINGRSEKLPPLTVSVKTTRP